MKRNEKDGSRKRISDSAASGAVALIFLIIGFQAALFFTKVVERPASVEETAAPPAQAENHTPEAAEGGAAAAPEPRKSRLGGYGRPAGNAPAKNRPGGAATPAPAARRVESFAFDPNTVSHDDLVRLGLSDRQAEVIEHYREKGGLFRSREDFARMYVVSDSLYERLQPFIEIPALELNAADSAALVSLRGIGPYYARRIVAYRDSLGGYYSPAQLLEIRGIDSARFAGFADRVRTDTALIRPLPLWEWPEERLAAHPYVGKVTARSIARYRRVYGEEPQDPARFTLEALVEAHVLTAEEAARLRHYLPY